MNQAQRLKLAQEWESYVVDGELGFWNAINDVRETVGYSESHAVVRRAIFPILADLLERGVIVAAEFSEEGAAEPFREWEGTIDSQISRMDFAWRHLGRWPELYEVCWLLDGPRHPKAEEIQRKRAEYLAAREKRRE